MLYFCKFFKKPPKQNRKISLFRKQGKQPAPTRKYFVRFFDLENFDKIF